jgi:hypothetical protein
MDKKSFINLRELDTTIFLGERVRIASFPKDISGVVKLLERIGQLSNAKNIYFIYHGYKPIPKGEADIRFAKKPGYDPGCTYKETFADILPYTPEDFRADGFDENTLWAYINELLEEKPLIYDGPFISTHRAEWDVFVEYKSDT